LEFALQIPKRADNPTLLQDKTEYKTKRQNVESEKEWLILQKQPIMLLI
jgi:hypothetical protein